MGVVPHRPAIGAVMVVLANQGGNCGSGVDRVAQVPSGFRMLQAGHTPSPNCFIPIIVLRTGIVLSRPIRDNMEQSASCRR